eukprot:4884797-Prymnesium_polylepis.1
MDSYVPSAIPTHSTVAYISVSLYTGAGDAADVVKLAVSPAVLASMHTVLDANVIWMTTSGSRPRSTIEGATEPRKPHHLSTT